MVEDYVRDTVINKQREQNHTMQGKWYNKIFSLDEVDEKWFSRSSGITVGNYCGTYKQTIGILLDGYLESSYMK